MIDEIYNLDDDFCDDLDIINDELTVFCEKTFTDYNDVIKYVEFADSLLRTKGLNLNYSDIEDIRTSLEKPLAQEVTSFVIPVYKENDQSEYNLVVSYYQDSEDSEYEIDMEVQYFWETMTDEENFEEEDQ